MKKRRSLRDKPRTRQVLAEALEPRLLLSANLVISEFMASNKTGLTDAAGDHPDWIEIHNAGDQAASLFDYFLTDDSSNPEKWRFPDQQLAAGGYLVVFADSVNTPPVANTELHTNFNLSASGEYLGLINAADDSVAFDYSPNFPPQSSDVSYGLFDANDPNSQKVFFSTPTPGAANSPSAQPVNYSVLGKTFTGTLPVTLSTTTQGGLIHYTTDGTAPTASSAVYTTTLSLSNTTLLRTIVTASGLAASPVESQSYIALNNAAKTTPTLGSSNVGTFTSNLPIIFINSFTGANAISDTVDSAVAIDVIDTSNGTASALGLPEFNGRAGFRIRGSTSESYPKKQYALETWDENNNGKNVSLLGLPSDNDWVLYAPYTEKIMMQNALAYQWANEMGHYASRTVYVEVFLNTSNTGTVGAAPTPGGSATPTAGADYLGIYILEEKVKIADKRVDQPNEISDSNLNGSFVINQDRTNDEKFFTSSVYGKNMIAADPGSSIDTSELNAEKTAWDAFETALSASDFADPNSADYYGKFIDVASFVDYYLLEEMTRNIDAYWLSTFYNKAADTVVSGVVTQRGLISAGPVWDFNLSLGTPNYNLGADADGWDSDTVTPAPGATGVSGFNPQDPYFQRLLSDPNFKQALADRWYQLRSTIFTTPKLMADMDANVSILANGTTNYPVGAAPTQPATDPIVRNFIRWPELGTFVTTDGMEDPAGSWIQDVNLVKNWLTARVNWMDSQYIPPPTVTPGGTYATPVSVTMSPNGPVQLTDTQLIGLNSTIFYKVPTANIANWQTLNIISNGVPTAPSGWSTGTTGLGYDTQTSPVDFTPYIKTNIQSVTLNKSADVFTLMNFNVSDPNSVQALILKAQYDDGFIAWVNGVRVMDAFSPENTDPAFNTVAAGSGDDNLAITFREFDITSVKNLLKAGNNTLAIQMLNSGSGSADFLLTPELFARTYNYPSAGQVYYTTDGSDPRTSSGAISSSAILYGGAVAVSTSTQINARTLVNGSWSALSTQSYDFNSTALRITELMYDPTPIAGFSGQDGEFVELQNVSASPLNLSGYQFTSGVTFTFPDVTLAPGQYAVVVKNQAAFAARYGNWITVLGDYGTTNFSNSGETVTLTDGFGNTVESFTYSSTWYSPTVGGGESLVVLDPSGDPSALNGTTGWRASFALDGAPGQVDSDATVPTVTSWVVNEGGVGGQPSVTLNFNSTVSAGSAANLSAVNTQTATSLPPPTVTFGANSITFTFAAGTPSGDYLLTLPAAGVINVSGITAGAAMSLNVLLVRAGSAYALPSIPGGLTIQQLVIGAGGTLDIGSNSLFINNPAMTLDMVRQLIAAGYDHGKWDGTGGITSSTAASAPAGQSLAIGYAASGEAAHPNIPTGQILLQVTTPGDADLSGTTDFNDYLAMQNDYNNPGDWRQGDWDYSGTVDFNDFLLLQNNLNHTALAATQSPTPSPALTPTSSNMTTVTPTPTRTTANTTDNPKKGTPPPTPSKPATPAAPPTIKPSPKNLAAAIVSTSSTATAMAMAMATPPTASHVRLSPLRRIARHRRQVAASKAEKKPHVA